MAIRFAIYTCPPIATAGETPDISSKDADCPASVAATTELATWIKSKLPTGCTLKHFVLSHAHGNHFFGLPILQGIFPSITAIATQSVVEGVTQQYSSPVYDGMWKSIFPPAEVGTGLPSARADFVALPESNQMDLDGYLVKLHDVPHGDTHANSFIHVPELDLVVASDIVYNGDCHQWLGEASTQEKRDKWIGALSQIAALKPKVVVPGHTFTPATEPDEAVVDFMLRSTEEYIKGFEQEFAVADNEEDLFKRMRARYSRWNLWILAGGCKAAMSAKQS